MARFSTNDCPAKHISVNLASFIRFDFILLCLATKYRDPANLVTSLNMKYPAPKRG